MSGKAAIARAVGVLGHELRNPLAAATTGTALLRELLDAADPRQGVVAGVAADLQRMSRLIDGYLDLLRCEGLRRLPVALQRLCATVAARHAGVVCDIAPSAMVIGDAILLERAVENLVENALQAGARSVRIDAVARGDAIEIAVEDDGPGVPAELRTRVFEPGFSRRGSTGLGLCIVGEVVRAHGGSVRCEAGARGARFCVELPAAQLAAQA